MCEVEASFTIALPKITCKIPANRCSSNSSVIMSFVDNLWSMEISGGCDQSAPLTVVAVKKNGLAKRAGIKVGDIITHINNSPADSLTLIESQLAIQEAGRSLKLTVKGDSEESTSNSSSSSGEDDEAANTVDFWFKPMKPEQLDMLEWQRKRDERRRATKKLYQESLVQGKLWNDRKKPTLRTSNCFMVANKKEREIKLKATKERFIESEKKRLTKVEEMMMRIYENGTKDQC